MLWHANLLTVMVTVTQVSEPQGEAAAAAADNTLSDSKEPAKVVLS